MNIHTNDENWGFEEDDDDLFSLLENDNLTLEVAVTFIDNPYSSLLVFQSSSSYITINGNEESCGSSFSDSGTSVMASVDMSGLRLSPKGKAVEDDDDDDEVLATFLGIGEDLLL
ncbi:uncharacterized protein LOC133305468 [Gastrolobium bilobum]|uniref:uncharacterized protein LOC133305468 n=1 Tax=Gastrolobium bilobum TaxID=150636 RepID=UPI002AB1954B|nr:uncharacterized protein LOC133305468 [Gastrolobium bilobum]